MTWRIREHRRPRRRPYFTVVNRADHQIRVGRSGQPSQYGNREVAKAEADRLNGQARMTDLMVIDDGDRF